MRRIASVLIGSVALVTTLSSPASADDNVLGLVNVKADNASILNDASVLDNANIKLLNQE
jgi:hypothetical protein